MSKRDEIVNYARKQLGKGYVYGANGPATFDCSGLVEFVYNACGIKMSRTTYTQINQGKSVTKDQLKPGDLIFFMNESGAYHVAIYTGNNKMIEAPNEKNPVREVSIWGSGHQFRDVVGSAYDTETTKPETSDKPEIFYRCVCGSFKDRANAEARQAKLKEAGFSSFLEAYTKTTN